MELLKIFVSFFKVGALTFGGGFSMFPMLQREVIDEELTEEQVIDYFAISQSLPGIIAVNVATFCGNKKAGFKGALAAALGVATPSIIIITLIAIFLSNFSEVVLIQNAFKGVNVVVSVLLCSATINLAKKAFVDKVAIALAVATFLLMLIWNVYAPILLFSSIAVGFIVKKGGRR